MSLEQGASSPIREFLGKVRDKIIRDWYDIATAHNMFTTGKRVFMDAPDRPFTQDQLSKKGMGTSDINRDRPFSSSQTYVSRTVPERDPKFNEESAKRNNGDSNFRLH